MNKNSRQVNFFEQTLFEHLVPNDHLLRKIEDAFDFDKFYEKLKLKYSEKGRTSKDPVMMIKILLLEFIYNLSDVQVARRIQTDIAFRWFLGLSFDDGSPDDTTISYFRTHRLDEDDFQDLFEEIVHQCISMSLVKKRRYIVDSTNVNANVNYPSDKKLLRQACEKLSSQILEFNPTLAQQWIVELEKKIEHLYTLKESVAAKEHYEIAKEMLAVLFCKTYNELQENSKYTQAYTVCYDIVDHFLNQKGDKIISTVDIDARVAYKSPGNAKKGYKNHIIMDEDSEIILGSTQTPFNVGDQKELLPLVDQIEDKYNLKPEELSADKVYGTIKIRSGLKDKGIISNINFYNESNEKEVVDCYTAKDFAIAEDLLTATCPQGNVSAYRNTVIIKKSEDGLPYYDFVFDRKHCDHCPLREECLQKIKGKIISKAKKLRVSSRYDALYADKERTKTPDFQVAMNMRFKIERRFATQVLHRGARRSRYIGMKRTSIQINLVNTVTNIIRAIRIIESLSSGTA
jgi:transposase